MRDAPISPLGVPAGTPLVVLIGGTFDPPHVAHIELPLRVRDELERRAGCEGRAWLVYIPAARSPHKETGPVASDAERAEMLRLALADRDRTAVWTDEIDRAAAGVPSYTVETVRRARRWLDDHGGAATRLRLLIGADQALAFHRWREPGALAEIAEPAVMLRPPIDTPEELAEGLRQTGAWSGSQLREWGARAVHVGVIDAAATSVRELLAAPVRDGAKLRELLDERVLEYIEANGLYARHNAAP